MLALNLFEWWYARGWSLFIHGLFAKLRDDADFFSIGLLLRTLFQPYRQISGIDGNTTFFQEIIDKLVSRSIGAVVRILVIVVGSLVLLLEFIFGLLLLIVWPAVPFLPILGLVLSLSGVMF